MSIPLQMMQNGFSLGRVAGININVNQSAFFLGFILLLNGFSFLGFSLATIVVVPIMVVLFLLSLLAHELGHSLVARSFGIQTEAITLHALGGVAKILSEPKTAGQEFLIAIAGPLVSLSLAAAFGLTSMVGVTLGIPDLVILSIFYLAIGNLALGVFNMLPGLPLDGGRALRAAVWYFRRDRSKATIVAATGGEIIGLIFYGLAFISLMGGDLSGAMMTGFMGWFLRKAATTEKLHAQTQGRRPGGLGGVFDLLKMMNQQRRRSDTGYFRANMNPQGPTPGNEDEEVIRYPDGREVYIRKR